MKRAVAVVAGILGLAVLAAPLYALYGVQNRGTWPASWPRELEGLRKQARTLSGPEVALLHYAIPFADREAFEEAWPNLLRVKTPGAPLVLRRGPSFWLGKQAQAGVCIHTPPAGERPVAEAKEAEGNRQRMVYVELIVDGQIVDLNRISLPPDTPILDERFEKKPTGP